MKNLAKSAVLAFTMMVAGSASADWFDCFRPIIGVDYYQAWMKAKNGWDHIFPSGNFPGATIYVGAKFMDCWGFEVGYDISTKKSRRFSFSTSNVNINGSSKIQRGGGHLDLIAYLPIGFDCLELFGSAGYGFVQPKITTVVTDNNDRLTAGVVETASGKGASVVRLGFGTNYMLSNSIGLRAKIGFESTASLKVKSNEEFNEAIEALGFTNKPFKSSTSLALGAFIKF